MAEKLGGTSENYKQFVTERTNKKFWDILK